MQAICCAFKVGQRDRLLPFASRAWALAQSLAAHQDQNVLARKLSVKLVTRIGLTFLKPRLAPWRYVRGGASLDVTLGTAGEEAVRRVRTCGWRGDRGSRHRHAEDGSWRQRMRTKPTPGTG